ncbi:MAG: MipA/OmpV family protein [Spirochaetes bacterium]|nr:MipA/OmpV family protein [Spirochaetota bacterium]
MIKKYISVCIILCGLCVPVFAEDMNSSDWVLSIFAAEKISPAETGSKNYEIGKPGPGARITFRNKYSMQLMIFSLGVSAVMYSDDYLYLSASMNLEPDDISDIQDVSLISSVEASAGFLFLETNINAEENFSLYNIEHSGFTVSPGLALRGKIKDFLKFSLTESITWADETHMEKNFSETDDGEKYCEGSAFESYATKFAVKWVPSEKWTIKFSALRGSYLEKASNSPAVKNEGGDVFWETKLMVTYLISL